MKDTGDAAGRTGIRRALRGRPRGGSRLRAGGWDFDRLVRSNAATLTFCGLALGVFVSRKFFVLPVAVAAVLAQDLLAGSLEAASPRLRSGRT